MTLVFICVILKILKIQYIEGDKYRKISKEKTTKRETVYANRGNIFSSNGELLATSMSKFTIRMDVVVVDDKVFEKNISALCKKLSNLLGKTPYYYKRKIRQAKRNRNRYLLIAKNVGYNDCMKMKTFPIFDLGVYRGGFIAEQRTIRSHPIGKIAERTIGYDDYRGKVGIEGSFAQYMKGENGWRLKQKIAKNQWKPINDINEKEPIDGNDVITTIDVNIQDITHHALLKQMKKFDADHGCAVVMETKTGEIKAISNLGKTSKGNYYEKRNYAVWESYEPGSTFKLASLMVGLEDKVIDTSTVVDTGKGRMFVRNKKIEDSKAGGHGKISISRVFEVSSNIGVVKVIEKYYKSNPLKFINRLLSFGLNNKTGVHIKGEGFPFIPSPLNKKQWSPITLEWMSWGYGVSLTPLQVLNFYNAVANDGQMVKPRFVKELRKGNKIEKRFKKIVINPRIASQNTINKVKKMMENVVKKGTAEKLFSSNFSMAGKTGTAKNWIPQKIDENGNLISGHYSNKYYTSSFVGFFPADKPKYSCIVVINKPNKEIGYYGAIVAGPVFKKIAHKIYTTTPTTIQYIGSKVICPKINKNYNSYYNNLRKYYSIMPNVIGMSTMDAVSLLENMGLKVKFKGIGKVYYQSIERGLKVKNGSVIYLKVS